MKVLFVGPLPPPIDGQSKASKVVYEVFNELKADIVLVNLTKELYRTTFSGISRGWDIFRILMKILYNRKDNDVIFLSLAESFLGNLRDVIIYTICFRSTDKIYIQMLGGAGMQKILTGKGVMGKINGFFLKRIAGVIVEGEKNFNMYARYVDPGKIHIIPNFAEDYLFLNEDEVGEKFRDMKKLRVLYLSNLLPGKGFDELVDAFISLSETAKDNLELDFVGGFQSKHDEQFFFKRINTEPSIRYLGRFIDGDEKRKLFAASHVFCLPTYYPYEGQPISILEAYATGCVVITTNHSGIPQVFSDKVNGYEVEVKSVNSLKTVLMDLEHNKDKLHAIAKTNVKMANELYRTAVYKDKVRKIFKKR